MKEKPRLKDPEIIVTQNRTEIDIPADIAKSLTTIKVLQREISDFYESINTMREWQSNYRGLIAADNKYDKAQLQQNIEAKEVDIRAIQNAIETNQGRIEHQMYVIGELEKRMKEDADGNIL